MMQSAVMAAACETEWRSLVGDHLPDVAVCQTVFARHKLLGYGVPGDRVVVKPNGMDASVTSPAQARFGALFAGRLSPEKGVVQLTEAWGEELPPLTVLGGGPLLPRLSERSARNVCVAGAVPRGEARRLMSRARVLVVPSLAYEGDPLVIIEALAAGTPVVCFDHGPLAEIGKQLSADCVVPTGDFQALVRGAARILDMSQADWTLLSDRAVAAYQREHTQARSVEALLGVYSGLAARVSRAQRTTGP
jgi:glycosyltransferase involved in cell wall biosynthesis